MTNETKAKFKAIGKHLEEARKRVREESAEVFKNACKELFNEYPSLDSFSWTQGTPSWNDGDTCNFSAHTDSPSINGFDGDALEYNDEDELDEDDLKAQSLTFNELKELQEHVSLFLAMIPEEVLEQTFGDNVEVTITRNGKVSTEDWDCGY